MAPEHVAGGRVHAGGGLVEDQHLGLVQAGGGQLQALADAQRQAGRHGLGIGAQLEGVERGFDGLIGGGRIHAVQAGVQLQVLAHGQLFVQREELRHVADVQPGAQVGGVHRLTQQARRALGDVEQAGEHLHGRGLATAVGAEEAEDLAAGNTEGHVTGGHEVAKAAGQAFGLHRRGAVVRWQRRNQQRRGVALAGELDVGLLQAGRAGLLQHADGGRAHQHATLVHGDEVVKALGLFHVGGGDQHGHVWALGAQALDQCPELPARQGVHARGGFVEDEQVGVVHQGGAQRDLLLHAARQLAGRTGMERVERGGTHQALNARVTLGRRYPEEARREIDVVVDGERAVQVAAQALRHVGHAGRQFTAKGGIGHIPTQHSQATGLQFLDTCHEPQQGGLAHPVRPHEADGLAHGQRQADLIQRRFAVVGMAHRLDDDRGLHERLTRRWRCGRRRSCCRCGRATRSGARSRCRSGPL